MDYIMIERTVYDAMVSALYECRELLAKSVNKLSGNMRQEWIDNHSAQAILQWRCCVPKGKSDTPSSKERCSIRQKK